MTTITLPPDIEAPLAEEAQRQGTTTELLALDNLRKLFPSSPPETTPPLQDGETLYDFLQGYVGTIDGTSEPLSETRRMG